MKKAIVALCVLALSLAGCSTNANNSAKSTDEAFKIYTSIYPLNYIAEEIGKEKTVVENVIPVGSEPHDFEPSGKAVADIKESDLFIYNGAGLEEWGEKISEEMDEKRALEACDYVDLIEISESDDSSAEVDSHGHGNVDPHIWLSPGNMIKIASAVKDRISELDPANKDYYESNYRALEEKLKSLDEKYRSELKDRTSNTILVSHSAFGYLARDYGIEEISVTGVTPFSEPSPRTIASLIDVASERDLKYIYFEVLASPRSVSTIAEEAKLEALTLNPLGGLTQEDISNDEDYVGIMEKNLENIKKELLK